ncbi:MAG: ABC transporter, partial [Armatimonadetes bacterium]
MTGRPLTARVVPPLPRMWRGKFVVERNILSQRRYWPVLLSGFFEPGFYLLAMGVGLGELAGDVGFAGTTVDYVS